MAKPSDAQGLRVDQWLWRARFYKTRSLAATAIRNGRVRVNGQRIKSSRALRVGDELQITLPRLQLSITVVGVPARRGPATEAALYYRLDHQTPRAGQGPRQPASPAPAGRPNKRSRRQLRTLKGKGGA